MQIISIRLGLRIESIGVIIILLVTLLALMTRGMLSAGLVGLSLSLVSYISSYFSWLVKSGMKKKKKIIFFCININITKQH